MKNVLLVFGGNSYEHDISVVTAMQIYKKSRLDNINIVLLYISRDDRFFVCNSKKIKLADFSKNKFNSHGKLFKEVFFVSGEKCKLFSKSMCGLKECIASDTAIIACHGGSGENGKLVSFFERFGICCSSGNVDSLAICMNKYLFKQTMKGLKIPVVPGFLITKAMFENGQSLIKQKINRYGFPLVIKANNGGSSIGLFIVQNEKEFDEKLESAFEFDNQVVVEKFIAKTREFNIAIVGDEIFRDVSEVDEPIKENDVLTFADKYLSGNKKGEKNGSKSMESQRRRFPAEISAKLADKIKLMAEKIFEKLGLKGVVRIDFLYDELNDKIYVCEVNAVPGSLAYYFYRKNLILTNDLICKLIGIAERNRIAKVNEEFQTNILDG